MLKFKIKASTHKEKKMKLMRLPVLIFTFLLASIGVFAEQKVVLISGASSGIGLSTAKAFQEKGWKVWAGCRQNIPDELKQINNIKLVHLDVTDENLVQAAVEKILNEDGRIDLLINNAGYGIIGADECVTIEEAQKLFDVNFFGVLRLTQAVLPAMRKQVSGQILNISGCVGVNSLPGLGIYSASKYALEGLSESLAATLSNWNIKVSIIEPGFVRNDWGKHCLIGFRACDVEFYQKISNGIRGMFTVSRGQTCEEIAEFIFSIAETESPELRYQTTSNLKEYIAEKLVDPSGKTMHEQNIRFLNGIINRENI
ncbi:MAG: SDR family oxidoreductase [Parachlamydiaceae bacterium]|nr:SDR family oxidoreductase [Parachlamydiaceae bacterium]